MRPVPAQDETPLVIDSLFGEYASTRIACYRREIQLHYTLKCGVASRVLKKTQTEASRHVAALSQPAADEDGEVKAEPPVTQPETERGDVESRHHMCPRSRAANRHVAALRLPALAQRT